MKRNIRRAIRVFTAPSVLVIAVILSGYWAHSIDLPRVRNNYRLVSGNKVTGFTINGPLKGFPLVVERIGDGWTLSIDGMTRYPANESYVAGFIAELARRRRLVSASGIGDYRYGTDGDGSCIVMVHTERGDVTLSFGQSNADERYRYVSLGGETVYRTDNGLAPWLDNRTSRWIDPYPYRKRLAVTSVQGVTVYGSEGYRAGSDTVSMKAFEYGLANLPCRDISNIPPYPDVYLRVDCGDASVIRLSFTRLDGGTVLLHEMDSGKSWVTGYSDYESLLRTLSDR